MRSLFRTVAVPVALATFVVSGCSTGDDRGDDPAQRSRDTREGTALTVREYRLQGNAICRRAARRARAVKQPYAPLGVDDYLADTLDVISDANRAVARLRPPPSLRPPHEESARLGRRTARVLDGTLRRVRASSKQLRTANREARRFARSRLLRRSVELTRRLGLNDCLRTGLPIAEAD